MGRLPDPCDFYFLALYPGKILFTQTDLAGIDRKHIRQVLSGNDLKRSSTGMTTPGVTPFDREVGPARF